MSLRKPDAVTRLLLSLWFLGGVDAPVKQGDLMKATRLGKEKVADYGSIMAELVADGSIVVESVGRSKVFRLLAVGVDRLRAGVLSPEFEFEGAVVGSRFVRPLLKFMREVVAIAPVVEAAPVERIEDYEEFKSVALETFDRLMAEFSYINSVPIYHIREAIGHRSTRLQFNEWMIQLQIDEVLEFSGCGNSKDVTSERISDSIKPPIGEVWYFSKRVK